MFGIKEKKNEGAEVVSPKGGVLGLLKGGCWCCHFSYPFYRLLKQKLTLTVEETIKMIWLKARRISLVTEQGHLILKMFLFNLSSAWNLLLLFYDYSVWIWLKIDFHAIQLIIRLLEIFSLSRFLSSLLIR